ncbi:MAG: TrmH family RNA methyltransferase [Candidatus Omnitrophota bacterium]
MRLYGKNPVLERIRSNPGSIRKLYLQKRKDLSEIVREAKKASLTFESVSQSALLRMGKDVHAQGVIAVVDEYKYTPFSEVLSECIESGEVPVFLDRVTDPQNLGSVIRSLACMGGFSVVIPEHESADVSETVLRVANGGENYIKIAKVTNTVSALKKAKEKGVRIIGAVTEGGSDIRGASLAFPLAIVIGSEGKGLRPGVLRLLDAGVSLPMRGASLSFNVAIATAIICYEIDLRRRRHER